MPSEHLEDWLRLWHVPGIGPSIYLHLLSFFEHNPGRVFRASDYELSQCGVSQQVIQGIRASSSGDIGKDIEWAQAEKNRQIVTLDHQNYPPLLKQISCPPPVLYTVGDLDVLTLRPCLAIVGSRKATSLGKVIAFTLGEQLAALGVTIVSGLAYGIDERAHSGALASEIGRTASVLAHGHMTIYPPAHFSLYREITQNGVVISEFSPNTRPLKRHFPRRNRIISGLCLGTLVVEATKKSGSLITARYALEQNREIFAIPGPINNPASKGCHLLIQQGAKLVTTVEDILVELPTIDYGRVPDRNRIKEKPVIGSQAQLLLDSLEATPTDVEVLIEKSGLTPDQVSSMLIELELSGHVACNAHGLYLRCNGLD